MTKTFKKQVIGFYREAVRFRSPESRSALGKRDHKIPLRRRRYTTLLSNAFGVRVDLEPKLGTQTDPGLWNQTPSA